MVQDGIMSIHKYLLTNFLVNNLNKKGAYCYAPLAVRTELVLMLRISLSDNCLCSISLQM